MNENQEVIYKYTLKREDSQTVDLPRGAKILSIQFQRGRLRLWASHWDTGGAGSETSIVNIVGTGNPVPRNPGRYFCTLVEPPFVWHIYVKEAE